MEAENKHYKPIKIETIQKQGMKSSQEKSFKKQLLESLPKIEVIMDVLFNKKSDITIGKLDHFHIYFINDEPCFLQAKDGPIIPHIKLLHKYPFLLPSCQVDQGGIKFLINGADVMIPGMLSKGGSLPTEKEIPNNIVAVYCEGLENAISIGQMQMSAEQMKAQEKGIGIHTMTYIGDESWYIK